MIKPTLANIIDAVIWNARSLCLSDERETRNAIMVATNHGGAHNKSVTVGLYPRVAARAVPSCQTQY